MATTESGQLIHSGGLDLQPPAPGGYRQALLERADKQRQEAAGLPVDSIERQKCLQLAHEYEREIGRLSGAHLNDNAKQAAE